MTSAWVPPRRLPVFFDAPPAPPGPRIRWAAVTTPTRLATAVIRSGGWTAVSGGLLLVVFNTASTLVPVVLGAVVDRGIAPVAAGVPVAKALGAFLVWSGVVAGLYLVINLTYRFGGRMGWYCVQRAQHELSARVVARLTDARGTAGPPRAAGRVLSIATSDCARTSSALYFAIYPLGNVVAILVAAVSLFAIHPLLGGLVTVGAPLILAVTAVAARPLRARAALEQDAVADASGAAGDLVTGHRVLTGIHASAAGADHYRTVSRAALRGALATATAEDRLAGISTALTGLFAGGVTVTAAVLALSGTISIGELVAAAGVAQVVLTPLQVLVEEAATLGAVVLSSAQRVLDLLGTGPHPAAVGALPVPQHPPLRIRADELDEHLTLGTGELLAVDLPAAQAAAWVSVLSLRAGPTGPGLPEVDLDDRPLHQHCAEEVRRTVLVAPHSPDLLEDTVEANLLPAPVADSGATAGDVLQAVGCGGLAQELPGGLSTPVADRGRTLSGGQRQRVALARAIAEESPVLVLHEPTSSVDAVTEQAVVAAVRAARRNRTTVVLTSSPAWHAQADRSVRPGRAPRQQP